MEALSEYIAFDYMTDGCYARAEIMLWAMADKGIIAGRVWNVGSQTMSLTYNTSTSTTANWSYHVAPVVYVEQPDGSVLPMVIDPSITTGPETVEEWVDRQRDPDSTTVLTQPGEGIKVEVDSKGNQKVVDTGSQYSSYQPTYVGPDKTVYSPPTNRSVDAIEVNRKYLTMSGHPAPSVEKYNEKYFRPE